jgi:lauroyl/myristoyl acyltransferase
VRRLSELQTTRPLAWRWQAVDYGWVLPLMARLPVAMGRWLSACRGRLNARLGRDWAELSLGIHYIGERTAQAAAQLWPALTPRDVVQDRYIQSAHEEWHGMLIQQGRLLDLHLDLSALQNMLKQRDKQRGLVVLTAHFDSFIVGMMGLGLCGETTSVTTSNVYKNPQVHPAVQAFFDRKYRAGEHHLGGGRFMHVETSTRSLMKALRRNETLVVVADAPAAANGNGLWLSWLGEERKLADGALRMALDSGSQLCAMVCVTDDDGRVRWLCSDIHDPLTDSDSAAKCFAHLERAILAHPGHWWAAHLLNDYPRRNHGDD